jgi:hypothetical protein
MAHALRRASVAIVGVLSFGLVAAACSGGSSPSGAPGAVGTAGPEAAFVDVQVTSALAITMTNRAAQPLFNVNVAIKPVAGNALFSTTIPRMESGETRNLQAGNFRRPDGTPLSNVLAFVRPKEIIVTAVDQEGRKREVTVPWGR